MSEGGLIGLTLARVSEEILKLNEQNRQGVGDRQKLLNIPLQKVNKIIVVCYRLNKTCAMCRSMRKHTQSRAKTSAEQKRPLM